MDPLENVSIEHDGTVVVIRIETDLHKVLRRTSKSGKSEVIATTGGALRLGDIRLNLTLYAPL